MIIKEVFITCNIVFKPTLIKEWFIINHNVPIVPDYFFACAGEYHLERRVLNFATVSTLHDRKLGGC